MIPFLFWPLVLPVFMTLCVNTAKGSKASLKEVLSPRPAVNPAPSNSGVSSEKDVSSDKSGKSVRSSTTDSLKVPRSSLHSRDNFSNSGKSSRKTSKSEEMRSETDSAKTEFIEVPLGKAAKDCSTSSILTPAEERKSSPFAAQGLKVTFAERLTRVKRRGIKREDPEDEKTLFVP